MKLSLLLDPKSGTPDGSGQNAGQRVARIEDNTLANMPKSKVKSLLANQKNVQNQAAVMPHDYIDKMHVSKSNWLGRMERGPI